MLNHLFSTPVWRAATGLTAEQLGEVLNYLMKLRATTPGDAKSNRGGWHSQGNLFAPEHRQFGFLREAVTRALLAYLGETCAYRGEIQLAMTAWTVINRAGDYNVPHNHPANLLSGVLYLAIPPGMRGGALVFQDPRFNLNAHSTEGMRRLGLRPPWIKPSLSVTPTTGDLLVFPSWLMHFVEPFQCDDPGAERVVISFNATV